MSSPLGRRDPTKACSGRAISMSLMRGLSPGGGSCAPLMPSVGALTLSMYTYDLQYPDFAWDQYKEMGPVDQVGAIDAFRHFPFAELIAKADVLGNEATAPTIIFRSPSDGSSLWYCMRSSGYREVYMECDGQTVTVGPIDESFMVYAINAFFSASHSDLYERMAQHPDAVTQRGLWERLKTMFVSK